jgi:hypothetical protein
VLGAVALAQAVHDRAETVLLKLALRGEPESAGLLADAVDQVGDGA